MILIKMLAAATALGVFALPRIHTIAFAEEHEHGHEEASPNVGRGKAVTEYSEKQGLKLSEKALKTIGVKTAPVTGSGTYAVPTHSLVYFKEEIGVYRLRDGWFKLIEVELKRKDAKSATIHTAGLKAGDQIANEGVPLLRVAGLDAAGGGEEGHGH